MMRETEELLAEVLMELLHELQALRREREHDEQDGRLADTLNRRWGYPRRRRHRHWR